MIAELAIQRTLAAYCHRCDDGDFARLAELFAPDGSFVFAGETVTGRVELEGWFERTQPPSRRGKHLTMNSVIDIDDDRARAVSDFLFIRAKGGGVVNQVAGRYRDSFVRIGDAWLIEQRLVEMMEASR